MEPVFGKPQRNDRGVAEDHDSLQHIQPLPALHYQSGDAELQEKRLVQTGPDLSITDDVTDGGAIMLVIDESG